MNKIVRKVNEQTVVPTLEFSKRKVKLEDLQPGRLFIYDDELGFKSEYSSGQYMDVYIIGSGERFCIGSTPKEHREALVTPVKIKNLKKIV